MPQISIFLPSYNYAGTLDEALASVFNQTFRDFELIAVDDGSTDSSLEVLERWRARHPEAMRVLRHPGGANLGLSETYGLALRHASGEFIAFLEADDVWQPDNLQKKAQVLMEQPGTGAVFSDYTPFGDSRGVLYWNFYRAGNLRSLPPGRPIPLFPLFLKRNPVASFSHFMTTRRLLESVPWPRREELYCDWWILAHLALRPFHRVPGRLVRWRIHPASANYGKMNLRTVTDLQDFLLRLYGSLKNQPLDEGSLKILEKAEKQMRGYWDLVNRPPALSGAAALARDPIQALRFFAHIILRNLLTGKRPHARTL